MTLLLSPTELVVSSDGVLTYPFLFGENIVHSECDPVFRDQSVHTLRADHLSFTFELVDTGSSRYFHRDPSGASDLHTGMS